MKKFAYSLQGVQRAKQAICDARFAEYLKAKKILLQQQERLQVVEDEIQQMLTYDHRSQGLTTEYLLQTEAFLVVLRKRRKEVQKAVKRAENMVEEAYKRFQQAELEVKKFDKLREREYEQWKLDARREEDKMNDEIARSMVEAGKLQL
jgi:flagellar FliJ protein